MAETTEPGTFTFLFTDIEGSTSLLRELGDAYADLLHQHNQILRAVVAEHEGLEVGTEGDGFFAAFSSPATAVEAAIEAQRRMQDADWRGSPFRVRMGMHTGEAVVGPTGFVGLAVHQTARVCSAAHGGQILVSGSVCEAIRATSADIPLRPLGIFRLKDVPAPEPLFQIDAPGLRNDFPRVRAVNHVTSTLPVPRTTFVGRRQSLSQVCELLRSSPLVTIVGAGGAGKTRLALQVVGDVVGFFDDGIHFVDLAPLTEGAQVAPKIATVVGVEEDARRDVMQLLTEQLFDKQALLILDNCEHVIAEVAEAVLRLLRGSPTLTILATSRQALAVPEETILSVPPLDLPDAAAWSPDQIAGVESVRLFVDRAKAVMPAFELREDMVPAVVAICCRLDGIPLALELAAARVSVLSPQQIATRLDDRFSLLRSRQGWSGRQETLEALLEWSHELLEPTERLMFHRLAVFPGSFTIDDAERVCPGHGVQEADVLDILARLVHKSLVVVEHPLPHEVRYRMLETIRAYAQRKLEDSGELELWRASHARRFADVVETCAAEVGGPHQVELLERLDRDHDNLRAALEWAVEADPAMAFRLVDGLYEFWNIRGFVREARHWTARLLEWDIDIDPVVRSRALRLDAMWAVRLGQYDEGIGRLDEALSLLRDGAAQDEVATILGFLGRISWSIGNYDDAQVYLPQALKLHEDVGDARGAGQDLQNLAIVAWCMERFDEAEQLNRRALELWERLRDKRLAALARANLAMVLHSLERDVEALDVVEEALLAFRELGDPLGAGSCLLTLAKIDLAQGDLGSAFAYGDESCRIFLGLDDLGNAAEAVEEMAKIALGAGSDATAAALLGAAGHTRDAIREQVLPPDRAAYETMIETLRSRLGTISFSEAWDRGAEMSLEQAQAFAREALAAPSSAKPAPNDPLRS